MASKAQRLGGHVYYILTAGRQALFPHFKKNLMKPCEYTVICGNLTDIMYPSIMSAPNSALLQHFGKGDILQSTFHRVEIFSPRNNMNKTML